MPDTLGVRSQDLVDAGLKAPSQEVLAMVVEGEVGQNEEQVFELLDSVAGDKSNAGGDVADNVEKIVVRWRNRSEHLLSLLVTWHCIDMCS